MNFILKIMEATVKKTRIRKPKPVPEQKIMVWHTVKRKNYKVAMEAIRELCKQWR